MPRIATQNHFTFVRSYTLNKPTAIEHQIDPLNDEIIDDPLVRMHIKKASKSIQNLIIHYTHEERLRNSKKHIHQLWNHIFLDTPVTDTKLIVGNCNSYNATKILIRRRPSIIISTKTNNVINLE
jgi:ATP-dependent Lon protease